MIVRNSVGDYIFKIIEYIGDPRFGLPKDVFKFVSQVTPMVNVDLLINDPTKGTLLAWRDDEFYGPGWHIPGGILRFKELAVNRINEVAKNELGTAVKSEKRPLEVNELIANHRDVRGHFISMLFRCELLGEIKNQAYNAREILDGDLQWHKSCPNDLIFNQKVYTKYIGLDTFVY
tara:strand:+ start:1713 stop:2240 length:528 start_codon:yes stop_codon:yes gene_type:complete